MKRVTLLLVAAMFALGMASAQAAEANLKFFSQIGNAPVDTADDVHYTLMSTDGDSKVFDSASDNGSSIEPGTYSVVAEQPSTHLFGTTEIEISDDDTAPKLMLLNNDGLQELSGVHECDNEGPCKCDDSCICRVFNHNCTERVCKCKDPVAAVADTPVDPVTGAPVAGQYPVAGNGLAAIGLGVAITALVIAATDDDDHFGPWWGHHHPRRPSSFVRYIW